MKYFTELLAVALLVLAAYLHSPLVALAVVLLTGVVAAERVFAKSTKDAAITDLVTKYEAYDKKLKELEMHVVNVAERAKTILGENF